MGNYTIFLKFENHRRGRQARNFSENDPKILELKSSSEQIIFRKLSLGAPDKFENNRRIPSKLPSANMQATCAPASCSLAPQNPSQLHNNRSLINKHCCPLRFDMTANYQV